MLLVLIGHPHLSCPIKYALNIGMGNPINDIQVIKLYTNVEIIKQFVSKKHNEASIIAAEVEKVVQPVNLHC